jgi:hypothetical protein
MIMTNQQYVNAPFFKAEPVAAHNVESLGDLCVYLTFSNYNYMTIEEATMLRDVLTTGIEKAMTAQQARYEKAVAAVADLTKRGMGGVTE